MRSLRPAEPPEPPWPSPPPGRSLDRGHVHVWAASLDRHPSFFRDRTHLLSAEERDRAGRFLRPADRSRWMAGRVLLRTILASYLSRSPEDLEISPSPGGKPLLTGDSAGGALEFSLSRSCGRALLAVSKGGPVGVDLERVRPIEEAAAIVEQYFSEDERKAFQKIAPDRRPETFFRLWTRKEAFLKARGFGLGDLGPRLEIPGGLDWAFFDLRPEPEYIGTLVTKGFPLGLSFFGWTPRAA